MAMTADQARAELARRELARRGSPLPQQAAPSMVQRGAQLATLPFRGYRGAAVGLENLVANPTEPNAALQRAAEATQTGFQPKGIPETAASVLGESVPLMPLGGALGSGSKIAQLLKAGMLGSGLSAIDQTATEGRPTLGRTAVAGAAAMAPTAAMMGMKSAFPYIAGKFTKTPSAAYEDLTSAFKRAFPGTPEAIEQQSSRVAPTLEKQFGTVGEKINSRRSFMGMDMLPKEAMDEMQAAGGEPRSLGRIAREFKGIQRDSAPIRTVYEESKLVGPRGEPLRKPVEIRGIPKGEKLRRLEDFSKDINAVTEGSYTTPVLQSKRAIEASAEKTGGTSYKILKKFTRQWGDLREIEKQLGTNLSDPNTAGKDLENIVRKTLEKPSKLSATDIDRLDGVEKLEKITGAQIIEPLRNQIKSSYTNEALSDFVPKGMLGKILLMKYFPEGVASFIAGSPKAMGGVAQALNNPAGPVSNATRGAIPSLVVQALRKNRDNPNQQP